MVAPRVTIDTVRAVVTIDPDLVLKVREQLAARPEAKRSSGVAKAFGHTEGDQIKQWANGVMVGLRATQKGDAAARQLIVYLPRDGANHWSALVEIADRYGLITEITRLDIALDYPIDPSLVLATARRARTSGSFRSLDNVSFYLGSSRSKLQIAVYDAHSKHGAHEPSRFPDPTTRFELRFRRLKSIGLDVEELFDGVVDLAKAFECLSFEGVALTVFEADLLCQARAVGVTAYLRRLIADGEPAVVRRLELLLERLRGASKLSPPVDAIGTCLHNQLLYMLEEVAIARWCRWSAEADGTIA